MAKKILKIPKIKQLKSYCGPASLSMVLNYLGHQTTQEELATYMGGRIIYERGVTVRCMINTAIKFGFEAEEWVNLGLEGVIEYVDKDLPIIARCKSPGTSGNTTHFYVIKGYDLDCSEIYVNDPLDRRREKYSWKRFNNMWHIKRKHTNLKNKGIIIKPCRIP